MLKGFLETNVFSKSYRKMVANLKKSVKQDIRDEEALSDIRTSEGKGRQGSASRPSGIPQSRQSRRSTGAQSGPANNEAQENSDAGTAPSTDATV